MPEGGDGRGATNTFLIHLINVRKLFFHVEITLGREDTFTVVPLLALNQRKTAVPSGQPYAQASRLRLQSRMVEAACLPLPRSTSCPFLGSSKDCGKPPERKWHLPHTHWWSRRPQE